MKLIKAILQPHALDDVLRALRSIEGLPGVMVSEVPCLDRDCDHNHPDKNMHLEIIVTDTMVDRVISTIHRAAHTGKRGDGGILVLPIERFVNIREEPL